MNSVTQEKQKIMCIATHTRNIFITEELEEIRDIMRGRNSGFDVSSEKVSSVERISELILTTTPNPQIIHICGEATSDGIIEIPDEIEQDKFDRVTPEELAAFFSNAQDVKCVVLNFCYSSQAAQLISKYIQCVIGIDGDIVGRRGAVEFSKKFYRSLEGKPLNQDGVDLAFSMGRDGALPGTGDRYRYIKLLQTKAIPEIQLIEPSEGSNISRNCQFTGTFKNLPDGASMWAYVNATLQRKFYLVPIDDYRSDGTWFKEVIVGEQNDTSTYRIGVLIVDQEVTQSLNDTFSRLGILSLDNLPNGSLKFGDRAVKRQ